MDYIGVVGTSFRTASVDELAAATLPADFRTDSLCELARLSGFSELVYLGTCNRVEFYFRGDRRIHTNELLFHLRRSLADLTGGACQLPEDEKLYVEFGRSAVRHLFRVTSALDSMMVGEAQITGQAKEAHQRAHDIGLLGGILDQTFHERDRHFLPVGTRQEAVSGGAAFQDLGCFSSGQLVFHSTRLFLLRYVLDAFQRLLEGRAGKHLWQTNGKHQEPQRPAANQRRRNGQNKDRLRQFDKPG